MLEPLVIVDAQDLFLGARTDSYQNIIDNIARAAKLAREQKRQIILIECMIQYQNNVPLSWQRSPTCYEILNELDGYDNVSLVLKDMASTEKKKIQDHFLAEVVPNDDRIFICGVNTNRCVKFACMYLTKINISCTLLRNASIDCYSTTSTDYSWYETSASKVDIVNSLPK